MSGLNVDQVWVVCLQVAAPGVASGSELIEPLVDEELVYVDLGAVEQENSPCLRDENRERVCVSPVRLVVDNDMQLWLITREEVERNLSDIGDDHVVAVDVPLMV